MSLADIDPSWIPQSLAEHEHGLESDVWRAMDTQDAVATLRLVDTLDELVVLEQLLANSLPPLPPNSGHLPPLLSTPFRYTSPHPSRFRAAQSPGLWYGADAPEAACAEVGYWRWRFLMDSQGLRHSELVSTHTLFQAVVAGHCLNLESAPWSDLTAHTGATPATSPPVWRWPNWHRPNQCSGYATPRPAVRAPTAPPCSTRRP
jgi:hypothetical protein